MKCRHCQTELHLLFIDLGSAPPSNAYLTVKSLHESEKWYPLRLLVCTKCWLVQTEDFALAEELFDETYAYFSGFSTSWLAHAQLYVKAMIQRFKLTANSHVVEIAANDGYLLQFVKEQNIPCTGVEPTAAAAKAAMDKGIEIIEAFFGLTLAQKMVINNKQADLIVANNVIAHVPDINDFVAGCSLLLKPEGIATFEFPHLMKLVEHKQFDTIYHEHFSYLSFNTIKRIFTSNGLCVFDVEKLDTHGGSLRVFAQRKDTGKNPVSSEVLDLINFENDKGMQSYEYYQGFQSKVEGIKDDFLFFLLDAKRRKRKIAAYGAAAKGNTLMNFAGVRPDTLPYVVDKNPAKQGKFMPGSRIPIVSESYMADQKPDFVIILPWNFKDEIMNQLSYIREWGGRFVIAVPSISII
jgi:predicted TPR repeat methyltransferase